MGPGWALAPPVSMLKDALYSMIYRAKLSTKRPN